MGTEGLDRVWGYEPSLENMENLMQVFAWNPEIGASKDLAKLRYEASIDRQLPVHVYGQCGHWTQIEKAAEFTQLVANFLTAE